MCEARRVTAQYTEVISSTIRGLMLLSHTESRPACSTRRTHRKDLPNTHVTPVHQHVSPQRLRAQLWALRCCSATLFVGISCTSRSRQLVSRSQHLNLVSVVELSIKFSRSKAKNEEISEHAYPIDHPDRTSVLVTGKPCMYVDPAYG